MHHQLAPTTHTVELAQLHEINAALACGHCVTAAAAGISATVPGDAVLSYLEASGPPEYPYIYGHFRAPGAGDTRRVELHTAHLRAISHYLSLTAHTWGVEPAPGTYRSPAQLT